MPLRPQWGDVGNANRAVGPAKQRGSELERALGARGGLYGTWGTHGGVKWLFGASGCDETKRTEPVRSEWAWDTERIELPPVVHREGTGSVLCWYRRAQSHSRSVALNASGCDETKRTPSRCARNGRGTLRGSSSPSVVHREDTGSVLCWYRPALAQWR